MTTKQEGPQASAPALRVVDADRGSLNHRDRQWYLLQRGEDLFLDARFLPNVHEDSWILIRLDDEELAEYRAASRAGGREFLGRLQDAIMRSNPGWPDSPYHARDLYLDSGGTALRAEVNIAVAMYRKAHPTLLLDRVTRVLTTQDGDDEHEWRSDDPEARRTFEQALVETLKGDDHDRVLGLVDVELGWAVGFNPLYIGLIRLETSENQFLITTGVRQAMQIAQAFIDGSENTYLGLDWRTNIADAFAAVFSVDVGRSLSPLMPLTEVRRRVEIVAAIDNKQAVIGDGAGGGSPSRPACSTTTALAGRPPKGCPST